MIFVQDIFTIFLGITVLALLSIYTVEKCRHANTYSLAEYQNFLFTANTKRYSLAGSIGSVFSITYSGAAMLFGHVFKIWFVLILCLAFITIWQLFRRILARVHHALTSQNSDALTNRRANILLEYFRFRLGDSAFRRLLLLYTMIYFFLLVEELAVSRMALSLMFPSYPMIPAFLLSMICLVIYCYIRLGGFRAILISDFEQLKLLVPTVVAVVFIVFKNSQTLGLSIEPHFFLSLLETEKPISPYSLLLGFLFLLAWFLVALDFYARFNFDNAGYNRSLLDEQKDFITVGLLGMFLVLLTAAIFGMLLPPTFSNITSPFAFTAKGLAFMFSSGSRATTIILFAGLFCMIFTTLDTLLITILQTSSLFRRNYLDGDKIMWVLVVAAGVSCGIKFQNISVIGIFIGSFLVVPLILLTLSLPPSLQTYLKNCSLGFIWGAVLLSILLLGYFFDWLNQGFERQYLIPGIVISSFLGAWCASLLLKLFIETVRRRQA